MVVVAVAACNLTEVDGSLSITSQPPWDFHPSGCTNGITHEFYGVDLSDGVSTVRVFQAPIDGWLVTVTKDGDPSAPSGRLAPATCTHFDASLDEDECGHCDKNHHGDEYATMSGHVSLECDWDGTGARVAANLTFDNCNTPEYNQ